MKIELLLEYAYRSDVLNRDLQTKNEELLNYYEFEILKVLKFDITNNCLKYDYFLSILNNIFKIYNIEFKNYETFNKIKDYFLAQIRLSFIFPCIFKFGYKAITVSCISILLNQLFPKKSFSICEIKELSDIKENIIQSKILFEKLIFPQQKVNNNFDNNTNTNNNGINFENIRTITANS